MGTEVDVIDIVTNDELITFNSFMKRLFELHIECRHESYLSEIFMPFFQMCSTENMKIVPVFDDRQCGPRTENETASKKRMETISARKAEGGYIVPDYIYVPLDYSFDEPKKPYLMIETKNPVLVKKEDWYYRDLSDFIEENYNELKTEIRACGYVIFTDGITWMFLEMKNDKIMESEKYKTIRLVSTSEPYYKTKRISVREGTIKVDLNFMGAGVFYVEAKPAQWNELKQRIRKLLTDLSKEDK